MFNKEELTEKIEKLRISENIAGMAVAVTDKDSVIYSRGFGCDNALCPDVPAYHDAMYKIASITKVMTSLMVMRMVEAGVLSLDIPIGRYLPDFRFSRHGVKETMTLRHLLTHTAGMPPDGYLEEGSRDEASINSEMKRILPTLEISSHPSEKCFVYSTLGYDLVGCAASAAAGKPLSKLMDSYVIKPLGMQTTTFDYHVASTYPLSLPHKISSDGKMEVIHYQRANTLHHAGGGLYSNASDLCRLARLFLNRGTADSGERLVSAASFDNMISKHTEKSGEPGAYYGLGIYIAPYRERYLYGHKGNWTPYNSSVLVDFKTGLGTAVLLNTHAPTVRIEAAELILELSERS